jgi:putative salt-induced outer membrane protein YdiY
MEDGTQMHRRTFAFSTKLAKLLGAVLLIASPALADEIKVGGDVLHGTIDKVTAETIEFSTDYGKGTISIPIEKVESVSSDKEFYFVHGDRGETTGKLLGIRDGSFVVGDSDATATAIPAGTVHDVYSAVAVEGPTGWVRQATALWHGSFDLGFAATESTLDTTGFSAGFTADRKKKPSRITFAASYRYSTNETEVDDGVGGTDTEKDTSENEAKGLLRGEYDIIPRLYWFGSQDAEYDEIESLSYRLVPKTGLGYRIWETDTGLFQLEAGGAYVYENFFGSDDDGYFSLAFGKLLEWQTPWYGSELMWRTDYLPAVDDWSDYLVRSEAALLIPMVSWLKFKLGVSETYDSEPAEDADENTLATTAGLAAVY